MGQVKCGESWVEEFPLGQDQDLTPLVSSSFQWHSLPTGLPHGQIARIGFGYAIL